MSSVLEEKTISLHFVRLGIPGFGYGYYRDFVAHHWWLDVSQWRCCIIWITQK